MSTSLYPCVDHIRPLLLHMPTLYGILGLVVHRSRRSPVSSVRQRLFDPVAIETRFVKQR